jgi:hypothetical protein
MGEFTNNEATAYAAVEEALSTYPLAPVPANFLPSVMAQIQGLEPVPSFRLNWLDYGVSLFVAGMAGLIILLPRSMPPQMGMQLQVQLWLLQQYLSFAYFWLVLLGGLGLFVLMIFSATFLFRRSQPSSN